MSRTDILQALKFFSHHSVSDYGVFLKINKKDLKSPQAGAAYKENQPSYGGLELSVML